MNRDPFMRHWFLGIASGVMAMSLGYMAAWIQMVGGLSGMMDDDSYPMSIIILPLISVIVSLVVMVVIILPLSLFIRWMVRHPDVKSPSPWLGFGMLSSIMVLTFSWNAGGESIVITFACYEIYLMLGFCVLWWISFHKKA